MKGRVDLSVEARHSRLTVGGRNRRSSSGGRGWGHSLAGGSDGKQGEARGARGRPGDVDPTGGEGLTGSLGLSGPRPLVLIPRLRVPREALPQGTFLAPPPSPRKDETGPYSGADGRQTPVARD